MPGMDEPTSVPKKPTDAPIGAEPQPLAPAEREVGGPKGPEPTRYGDWERNGICRDF